MRNAGATGRAAAPRFERVGSIARLRSGFFLAELRFMTVTSAFGGALPRGLPAPSLEMSIARPAENQQRPAGAAPGLNPQEPLQELSGCSSGESATAGDMVEVRP
jgi:hypothetical protein